MIPFVSVFSIAPTDLFVNADLLNALQMEYVLHGK
jgi:hypothetical protein